MLKSIVLSGKKLTPEECRQNILDIFEMSTPEQREEILSIWRNRMPALGLKQTI